MAGENSVRPAPLTHHDSAAHRRLIAERANAIAYEEGQFIPTLEFASLGDLSNAYSEQVGYFWRIGPLVYFSLALVVTPTFTTSSGALRVLGLPYQSSSDHEPSVGTLWLNGSGVTWPSSRTAPVAWVDEGQSYMRVHVSGSGSNSVAISAADVSSGVELSIRANGFYPIQRNA